MAELLNPAKMIAAYGNYYKEGNITRDQLYKQLFARTDFASFFNVRPTNDTRIDTVNLAMGPVLQAFQSNFSPKGMLDFVPNPWYLDRVKINVETKPDVLAATALDFFVQKGVKRSEAPIIATVAEYLIQKAQEDKELTEIFKGAGQPVIVAGTATGSGESLKGIRAKIRAYVTGGQIPVANKITMGAIPADPVDFVTYIETFYNSIPEIIRDEISDISLPSNLLPRFKAGMREKYNQYYAQATDLVKIMDTNVDVKGFAAQNGSSLLFATPKMNRIGFVKGSANKGVFDLGVKDIYSILMATDWYEGYDFINPAWVYHTDQDLV